MAGNTNLRGWHWNDAGSALSGLTIDVRVADGDGSPSTSIFATGSYSSGQWDVPSLDDDKGYEVTLTTGSQVRKVSGASRSMFAQVTLISGGLLKLDDGTAAAPSATFRNDLNSGWYRIGADNVGLALNGVKQVDYGTVAVAFTPLVRGPDGAVATPAFSFTGDTDTGWYRIGADNPGIAIGGIPSIAFALGSYMHTRYSDTPGIYPGVIHRRARGTSALPTAAQLDDQLGQIQARGYGATAFYTSGTGAIDFYAAENFTDAAMGTYIDFATTPTGSITRATRMRIHASGAVWVGGTAVDVDANNLGVQGTVYIYGDGGGLANSVGVTDISDLTANSSGVGTVLFKGATSRNSSGFLKVYVGTTAYYVPLFSAISG